MPAVVDSDAGRAQRIARSSAGASDGTPKAAAGVGRIKDRLTTGRLRFRPPSGFLPLGLPSSMRQIPACTVVHLALDSFLKFLRLPANVGQAFENLRQLSVRQRHPANSFNLGPDAPMRLAKGARTAVQVSPPITVAVKRHGILTKPSVFRLSSRPADTP